MRAGVALVRHTGSLAQRLTGSPPHSCCPPAHECGSVRPWLTIPLLAAPSLSACARCSHRCGARQRPLPSRCGTRPASGAPGPRPRPGDARPLRACCPASRGGRTPCATPRRGRAAIRWSVLARLRRPPPPEHVPLHPPRQPRLRRGVAWITPATRSSTSCRRDDGGAGGEPPPTPTRRCASSSRRGPPTSSSCIDRRARRRSTGDRRARSTPSASA